MGISMNGPSGIDTASLIEQLTGLEQQRVTKIETVRDSYNVKISAYTKFKSFLSDISTKARALNSSAGFNLYGTKSSDESLATISGNTGATEGTYAVKVYQLAQAEKMMSRSGQITSQSDSLSSLGVGSGTFSIDGTEIAVGPGDTIQDLRMKINNAKDSNGAKLNVTASVLKVADNNYRLVLTGKNTGAAGVSYKDVGPGTTLQDLGIIATADGDKGNVAQAVRTAGAFAAPAAGDVIAFTGADHNGTAVAGTFIASGANPANDLLASITAAFNGTATASFDADGKLVVTDNTHGASQFKMTALTLNNVAVGTETAAIGKEGAGVVAAGRDSYFALDGLNLTDEKNSIDSLINGVTLDLKKADATKSVTLGITRDVDGIQKKISDLLNSYNALLRYGKEATVVGNPKDKNSKSGDLSGDMTINTIISQVRSTLQTSLSKFGGTYTSLTAIGVKTDSKSGEMSLEPEKFKAALNTNFDEVVRLFVQGGYSTNSSIQYGRSTKDTQTGKYEIEEVDAMHVRMRLQGDPTWYTSESRDGNVLAFTTGPSKGLSITAPVGSLGGTTAAYTFVKGIGVLTDDLISKLTDAQDGMVTTRQESMRRSITLAQDRVDRLQMRVDSFHDRLVKQFSAMEQSINNIKQQSSSLSRISGY